ncbi:MAG: CRTAC1 family protein [Balneolaceae bacterium]|nr:CRTAC1 family protein [Balneolaceae bacterium]
MIRRYELILLVILLFTLTNCSSQKKELRWTQEGRYRWAPVETGFFNEVGFESLDATETRVNFRTHITQEEINNNQILLNGTGVATADVDGDGWTDIYFTQLNGPNRLYKNMGGFEFQDVTEQAGVAHEGNYSTGTLFADVDGDRDQDLLVSTINGENALYINDGEGNFERKEDSGLQSGQGSTTMTMADIDSDGDLDLFVANNKKKPVYDLFTEQELEPKRIVKRPEGKQIPGKTRYEFVEPFGQYYRFIYRKNKRAMMEELGEFNRLFLNDGSGHFTEVTDQEGRFLNSRGNPTPLKKEWSLTARFQDINGDHLPDLYICNDYFNPDRIWINQGDGRFKEVDTYAVRSFSYSAMGIDVSDINRDGYYDFFVTEMLSSNYQRQVSQYTSRDMRPAMIEESPYQPQYMHNSMYLNRGDNTFQEIAYYSGLEASEWSWATRFMDLNLDGYEDLVINTGYPYDAIDMDYSYNSSRYKGAVDLDEAPGMYLQNKIFRNNGDLTFSEKSGDWGFTEADISYGMATADFDNDGDLDIVTSRFGAQAALYKNNITAPRIGVRLRGKSPNTEAIGAEVVLEGGPVHQSKQVVAGGDYLSGSTTQLMFAARAGELHKLAITWPNGQTSRVDSVTPNRIYEITEPDTSTTPNEIKSDSFNKNPVFENVSDLISHRHQANLYNDFEQQPLIPYKISSEGLPVAWVDIDRDNDDDLLISNGEKGTISIYENRA